MSGRLQEAGAQAARHPARIVDVAGEPAASRITPFRESGSAPAGLTGWGGLDTLHQYPPQLALSYVYRYAGALEESAREGVLALALDLKNPRYRSVATTYLHLGTYDRSAEVHRLDPDSPWSLGRLGQLHLRQGRKDVAVEHFERVINCPFMVRDPFLDPARSDPRFQRILAQAKARHDAFMKTFLPAAS